MIEAIYVLISGLAASTLGGLLGIGEGIVLVPFLRYRRTNHLCFNTCPRPVRAVVS